VIICFFPGPEMTQQYLAPHATRLVKRGALFWVQDEEDPARERYALCASYAAEGRFCATCLRSMEEEAREGEVWWVETEMCETGRPLCARCYTAELRAPCRAKWPRCWSRLRGTRRRRG